jgi:hypothetical protein
VSPYASGSQPVLISFLFALDTERGHLFEYNKAVGQAARLAGWEHRAAVRAAARVAELPAGWEPCLGSKRTIMPPGPLARGEKGLRLFFSLSQYLRQQAREARPIILFLEWFDFVHLLPFTLALATVSRRERFAIWVVHRLEGDQRLVSRANRFLLRWLRLLVQGRLVHLSDSELVVEDLARFGYSVHLLPIPHTVAANAATARAPLDRRPVVAWLPGQALPSKGVEAVRRLTSIAGPEAEALRVVASEASHFVHLPGACQVALVPDVLPRPDYVNWMQSADIILLPYDSALFRARTSGIFVEAIVAGKIAVVTDGTWMAHELRKYGLDKLILDWTSPTILSDVLRLAADKGMRARLGQMQAAYAEFHSVPGYAASIQRIFGETYPQSG